MENHWKFSDKLEIDPTELKSEHNKFYTELSLKKAIKRFQLENNIESYSEAGRILLIEALRCVSCSHGA